MKLTRAGSIREELNDIPTRNWWKYGFLVPIVLILLLGVIDLFMSSPSLNIWLVAGSLFLFNHLSVSFFKKKSHKKISSFISMAFALILLYQQLILRNWP